MGISRKRFLRHVQETHGRGETQRKISFPLFPVGQRKWSKNICAADRSKKEPETPFSVKRHRTEGVPTQVCLPVDYGVVVYVAVAVPLHGFYVIRVISCVDGSLKLTLKHRTVAGGITFAWKKDA